MFSPHDNEGRSAWDYAAGMWGELYQMRRLMEDEGETSTPRWLSIAGDAYAGGGLVTTGQRIVPPGMYWTAMAVSGSSGSNGADILEVFRNSTDDSGFITRLVANAGRWSMVNLPDNLVLQENTIIIVRSTILAAADGRFPTVNIATREIHTGPAPVHSQEAGENISTTYGDAGFGRGDEFPERLGQVEYEANGRR